MQHAPKWLYFFLLLLSVNLFLYNGQISLWDEDEAAYAGFASTMLETGNWIQPEFIWSHIHRKTPLHFWNIAMAYQVFGVNEWATRLSSAIAVLLTCLVLWKWGALVFGRKISEWAAIVLATSLVVPITGKMALTDATLLLFQTSAVLALFNYLRHPSWKWNLLFWSSMALGILTKGPLVIILCGGIWLFLMLFHPERKTLVGMHPWFFAWFALAPTALWMFASWQQDKGELVSFLYDWYVVQRVGGSVLGQQGLPGYHLLVITIAFLPWLAFLIPALVKQFRHFRNKENTNLLISGWLLFGWLFFEAMSSKLPSYALGAHPAIAILIGQQIVAFLEKKNTPSALLRIGWLLNVVIVLVIAVGLPYAIYRFFDLRPLLSYFVFTLFVIVLLVLQIYFWQKQQRKNFVGTLAMTGGSILFLIITCLLPIVENSPMKSLKEVSLRANELVEKSNLSKSEISIVLVDLGNKQTKISLPFYLRQQFNSVTEENRKTALKAFLTEHPMVLVLNYSGLEFLTTELEKRAVELPEVKEVEWWSTDDKLGRHDYYLIGNF